MALAPMSMAFPCGTNVQPGAIYNDQAEGPDAFPKMILENHFFQEKQGSHCCSADRLPDAEFVRRNSLEPGAAQLHVPAPSLVILMTDIGANGDLLPFH